MLLQENDFTCVTMRHACLRDKSNEKTQIIDHIWLDNHYQCQQHYRVSKQKWGDIDFGKVFKRNNVFKGRRFGPVHGSVLSESRPQVDKQHVTGARARRQI